MSLFTLQATKWLTSDINSFIATKNENKRNTTVFKMKLKLALSLALSLTVLQSPIMVHVCTLHYKRGFRNSDTYASDRHGVHVIWMRTHVCMCIRALHYQGFSTLVHLSFVIYALVNTYIMYQVLYT